MTIIYSASDKFHSPLPSTRFETIPEEIRAHIVNFLSKVDRSTLELFSEKVQSVSAKMKPEFVINKINLNPIPLRSILFLKKFNLDLIRIAMRISHVDIIGLEPSTKSGLPVFSALKSFNIKSLVLTPKYLENVAFTHTVRELTLKNETSTFEDMGIDQAKTIFKFSNLQKLELNQVCNDATLNSIVSNNKLRGIRVLSLKNLFIQDGLEKIGNLSSLKHLQINECTLSYSLPYILYSHPSLNVLDISNSTIANLELSTYDLPSLASSLFNNCPPLKEIQFNGKNFIREENVNPEI